MQLLTQYGCFTILAERGRPDQLVVHAPAKADLVNLRAVCRLDAEILHVLFDPSGEYQLDLPAARLPAVLNILARTVDYPDFLARIAETPVQADRTDVYRQFAHALSGLNFAGRK